MTDQQDRRSGPTEEELGGASEEAEKKSERIEPAPGAPMPRGENR